MKTKIKGILVALVILVISSLTLTACGYGGSDLYKKYLKNPNTPTIGNTYVAPDGKEEAPDKGSSDKDDKGNSGNNNGGGSGYEGLEEEEVPTC